MYASSESVLACFPNPNRTVNQDSSRLLTEKSISNLIKALTKETGGFVISFNNENIIKFVLDGYYFEVNMGAVLSEFSSSSNIYATVNYNGGSIYGDVADDSSFQGVDFTQDEPVSGSYLHILKKSDGGENWNIAPGSIYRFDENSISYDFGTFPQNS